MHAERRPGASRNHESSYTCAAKAAGMVVCAAKERGREELG
jgi:hypothetical protein